jgi:hypothetical protein
MTFMRIALITVTIILWTVTVTCVALSIHFKDKTGFIVGGMVGIVAYLFSRDLIKSESND